METLLIAPGSRGDIQPYIALGRGLQGAGHHVRIVTNQDFDALVTSYGLEICPVDVDVQAALQTPDARAAIERGGLITSFRKLAELASSATRKLFEVGLEAAREADLIVAGLGGMLVAASLSEKLGIPFIQAHNIPLTSTSAYPGALLPWLSFPPRAVSHRLSHWLTRQVVWQTARPAANRPRMELLGLPPLPLTPPFDRAVWRSGPLLYGFSPAVLPGPADWGPDIHVTGFWFADAPEGWAPPPELAEFLAGGPPPVYVGFGSMGSEKPAETMQLILDALATRDRRAIVHSGWAGLTADTLPKNVLVVGSVPHSWLFPRVAAVVHHGGAGTTAAAIRAGVPSVVVPFHGDQPFWADLTYRLHVGAKPIPRRKLSAERLAAAIDVALGDAGLRRAAAELGERVRQEDGVGTAVRIIEERDAGV